VFENLELAMKTDKRAWTSLFAWLSATAATASATR
jgi:ABC-type uncharacterized transport system ATPase subunit